MCGQTNFLPALPIDICLFLPDSQDAVWGPPWLAEEFYDHDVTSAQLANTSMNQDIRANEWWSPKEASSWSHHQWRQRKLRKTEVRVIRAQPMFVYSFLIHSVAIHFVPTLWIRRSSCPQGISSLTRKADWMDKQKDKGKPRVFCKPINEEYKWQDGETVEIVTDYFSGAPKSLQMVTAATKLKDTCSLEEKLWPS